VSDRVPYAERERQINEFCTCHYIWSERDGETKRHERLWRDPKCKLHGHNTERSPF